MTTKLKLSILEGRYTIHRLSPDDKIPDHLFKHSFYSVTRTTDELSVVCSSAAHVDSGRSEPGWSCIKVCGPLDFSLTGILADLSVVLAEARISIFTISTFDTDYLLVRSDDLQRATRALKSAGYSI